MEKTDLERLIEFLEREKRSAANSCDECTHELEDADTEASLHSGMEQAFEKVLEFIKQNF